jgi:transposase
MDTRTPYLTEVSDEEWAFVVPYLTLAPQDAAQRKYPVREVFNGVRDIVKSGAQWRLMPHDLPPWPLVYQPLRPKPPSAVILDARTIQSTPERGARAGDDGHKRRKGSKVHAAVDPLGHLQGRLVTPASEQELAYVELGSTSEEPAAAATAHGIQVAVVKLPEAHAWATRFRRLARDNARLAATLATLHFLAFVCLLLHRSIASPY